MILSKVLLPVFVFLVLMQCSLYIDSLLYFSGENRGKFRLQSMQKTISSPKAAQ